jgi:hypothetical protein
MSEQSSRRLPGHASETPVAARQTTILESVTIGAGTLIVGLSYLAGVVTPAGLTITVGIVLILSSVMFIVAAWLADRTDKRLRTMLYALDRYERDRIAEYGALMRKIENVGNKAEAVLSDWGQRIEDMYVACDAAEARRNVERTDQLQAVRVRIDDLTETFAGELLAVNGALNGLRSTLDDMLQPRPDLDLSSSKDGETDA